MSKIQSSAEHLTLNADGSSKDIKLQSNGSEKVIIKSDGNVGIGEPSPQGTLHVKTSDSGATAVAGADDLIVEVADYGGISILSENEGHIYFGDNEDADVGRIEYQHSENRMVFRTNTSDALIIDSSGNVGIGVTPKNINGYTALEVKDAYLGSSGNSDLEFGANVYYDSGWKYRNTFAASLVEQYNGSHTFKVASSGSADSAISWTTALTIDNSGNTVWGTGSTGNQGKRIDVSGGIFKSFVDTTGTGTHLWFINPNSVVGSIQTSGSSTQYNTSSDYRLKENVVDMENATDRVKQLKPKRFNFIADDSVTVDGFIAHEVSDIVPEAISGEKDAMMDEEYEVTPAVEEVRNEEGNITTEAVEAVMGTRSVPDYQGIDQSKLVPLLVKTIQELEARITALEA